MPTSICVHVFVYFQLFRCKLSNLSSQDKGNQCAQKCTQWLENYILSATAALWKGSQCDMTTMKIRSFSATAARSCCCYVAAGFNSAGFLRVPILRIPNRILSCSIVEPWSGSPSVVAVRQMQACMHRHPSLPRRPPAGHSIGIISALLNPATAERKDKGCDPF